MAEIIAIELKIPTPSGFARFTINQHPLDGNGSVVIGEDDAALLPTVKKITGFKHEIDSGRVFVGPCYLVTLEEDLKLVVDKNDVALVLYRNEKKADIA
jgi:hypothetical protein